MGRCGVKKVHATQQDDPMMKINSWIIFHTTRALMFKFRLQHPQLFSYNQHDVMLLLHVLLSRNFEKNNTLIQHTEIQNSHFS